MVGTASLVTVAYPDRNRAEPVVIGTAALSACPDCNRFHSGCNRDAAGRVEVPITSGAPRQSGSRGLASGSSELPCRKPGFPLCPTCQRAIPSNLLSPFRFPLVPTSRTSCKHQNYYLHCIQHPPSHPRAQYFIMLALPGFPATRAQCSSRSVFPHSIFPASPPNNIIPQCLCHCILSLLAPRSRFPAFDIPRV